MRSFAIGRVLEPELREVSKKLLVEFGLLVGRESVVLTVWDGEKSYNFASGLSDGDRVICVLNTVLDSKGGLKHYVNDMVLSPDGLREDLLELFKPREQPASVAIPEPPKQPARVAIPEPPKKAGA